MPIFPGLGVSVQAAQFPVSIIGQEHYMLQLPGGVFPMGSKHVDDRWHDAPPHMVRSGAVRAGIPLVSEGQYRKIMGEPANEDAASLNHPATHATWFQWEEYMRRFNLTVPAVDQVGFLTEVEGEYVARGGPKGVVDVRKFQAENDLRSEAQLIEHLQANGYYLENFILIDPIADPERALELGTNICTDIHSEQFKRLINSTSPVFAWYGFATLSGQAKEGEAWFNKKTTAPVSLRERVNRAGIVDAMGNAWEWRGDVYEKEAYSRHGQKPVDPANRPQGPEDNRNRVFRGGGFDGGGVGLRVASRYDGHPVDHDFGVACRLGAAPVPQDSPA